VIVENVDTDGRAVPAGEPGARLLVTNLSNLVQPIIRLEINDAVTLSPEQCSCGRTLCRTAAVEGRSDDVLDLDGVTVHPMQFAVVTRDREVREFQVRRGREGLQILVVPGAGAGSELEERVAAAVREQLAGLGVRGADVTVERRDELARSAGGKLQLVVDAV
jgi:phenylacetate-CoA ligase